MIEEEIGASEALARTYRERTGVPIVVGSNFMWTCREAGMDTRDLLEIGDLLPAAVPRL